MATYYLPNGNSYEGDVHYKDGQLMSGASNTANSEILVEEKSNLRAGKVLCGRMRGVTRKRARHNALHTRQNTLLEGVKIEQNQGVRASHDTSVSQT